VFDGAEDYFTALTGDHALPCDVQSLFYAAPEGLSPDVKELLVIERDGEVVGVIDAIPGHPEPDALAVGLFVIAPSHRRAGVGSTVARALLELCRVQGMHRITATSPAGWEPGVNFLQRLGFLLSDPLDPGTGRGNRNVVRTESSIVKATLLLPD
jgi:GNAT superfamily N-acetyltransferase